MVFTVRLTLKGPHGYKSPYERDFNFKIRRDHEIKNF